MSGASRADDASALAREPFLEQAVSLEELRNRVAALRAEISRRGLGVALLTTPESVYYLSGYQTRAVTASQALAITPEGEIVLIIRRMDEGNYRVIAERSPVSSLVAFADAAATPGVDIVAGVVRALPGAERSIGLEPGGAFVSPLEFERLRAALRPAAIEDIGGYLDRLRLTKSPWEIARHRAAGALTVAAMRSGIAAVKPGALDSEIAAEVAATLLRAGSEWVATWPIVLTGRQTGRPHSSWQHHAVEPGQPTTLELSGVSHRYHSPMLRTVIVAPTAEQVRLAEAVSQAHRAGVRAVRAGVRAHCVYDIEREVMAGFGCEHLLGGRVGYGIGISFAPNWLQRGGVDLMDGDRATLEAGMALHLVTMVMRADEFGIAHSSTVVVTADGCEALADDGLRGPLLL